MFVTWPSVFSPGSSGCPAASDGLARCPTCPCLSPLSPPPLFSPTPPSMPSHPSGSFGRVARPLKMVQSAAPEWHGPLGCPPANCRKRRRGVVREPSPRHRDRLPKTGLWRRPTQSGQSRPAIEGAARLAISRATGRAPFNNSALGVGVGLGGGGGPTPTPPTHPSPDPPPPRPTA